MDRYLVVVGCSKEKLDKIDKKSGRKMLDFINGNCDSYTGVISIIRKKMNGDRNFRRSNDSVATDTTTYLDYPSNNVIEVPGYDVDCGMFRKDTHYDIMGISTAASVLCIAMSMYSIGLDVSVLTEYCDDRKGKNYHKCAVEIMKAYMPDCIK